MSFRLPSFRLPLLGSAALLAFILGIGEGGAASFNCRFAKLPVEVAICNERSLGAEDEEMARIFFALVNAVPTETAAAIKAEQGVWLARRNLCGYDEKCILTEYRGRIARLVEWQQQAGFGGAGTRSVGTPAPAGPAPEPPRRSSGPLQPR